jgi:dihydrofolate synthase / folylpolyglutamate synthase
MQVTAYKLKKIVPPKDDFFAAIRASKLSLKEGDIIAISSKIVSIGEGRCVPIDFSLSDEKRAAKKVELMKKEAQWWFKAPTSARYRRYFTIAGGAMIGSAGIDESNASGHYVLYPKDPFKSARELRTWLMKEYKIKELAVIITDSTSLPMRRGAIGFALSWDGLDPLKDYKGTEDIFGRSIRVEVANIVDALATSAVLAMGEGNEQTPIAVIRRATSVVLKNRSPKHQEQLIVAPDDDVFAPLIWRKGWKKGGAK